MPDITEITIAVISSGLLTSVVTTLINKHKSKTEIEQLRQQVEAARTDDRIKIDEYIQSQFMELAESYKKETERRNEELEDMRKQNTELMDQIYSFKNNINELNTQFNQLMSWVAYDMLSYQSGLEKELMKVNPDIKLPTYRKPPKFVQDYITEHVHYDDGTEPSQLITPPVAADATENEN